MLNYFIVFLALSALSEQKPTSPTDQVSIISSILVKPVKGGGCKLTVRSRLKDCLAAPDCTRELMDMCKFTKECVDAMRPLSMGITYSENPLVLSKLEECSCIVFDRIAWSYTCHG